jgi:Tfp pilus assembly protein PilX
MCRLRSTDGAALLIALMAMMLMTALATALMLTTITETRIASSYGAGIEAFYAADAAIERAIDDLRTIPDWSGLAGKAATVDVRRWPSWRRADAVGRDDPRPWRGDEDGPRGG